VSGFRHTPFLFVCVSQLDIILTDFTKFFFFGPMPPHILVDFVVLPSEHGRSVTDFWVWDAHEAQLSCPDDVSGDIGGCSARRALKPKFYQPTQTMVTAGILPFRENSHGRTGNRSRDLMISRKIVWPLDHEARHVTKLINCKRPNNEHIFPGVFSKQSELPEEILMP